MCFIVLIFHFFSCVLRLFIFLSVSSCFFSCALNYLLILFFFIFCLFRCNAKKRREFPIDCSSPCGKAGLDQVLFLSFCFVFFTWEVDKLNPEVPTQGLRWCLLGVSGFLPTSLGDETILDPSHGVYGLQDWGGKRFHLVLNFSLKTEI